MISQLLAYLDSCLALVLNDAARLVCWSVLAGSGSMLLYRVASPQGKLQDLQQQLRDIQAQLKRHDDDFAAGLKLARRQLGLAFQRLGLVVVPSLVAALPVLVLLPALDAVYGYRLPAVGETVKVTLQPPQTTVAWAPQDRATWNAQEAAWQLRWPTPNQTACLESSGVPIAGLPAPLPVPTIAKRNAWNVLFANPAGYVRPEAPVDAVTIHYPPRTFLNFGPDWLRSWLTVYFIGVFLSAVVVKVAFRIT